MTLKQFISRLGNPFRRREAPSPRRDPIAAAQAYGIDISLLKENLRRTPEQRIRQLDSMLDFARRVRRV